MSPVQEIEFLGVTINSLKMFLSLPQEKVLKIQSQCQDVYAKGQVTVHELKKMLRVLASTIQAVLPAQLNVRYLQQQQIKALIATQYYQATVLLNSNSKEGLQWWIQNLHIFNGCYLIHPQNFLTIRTDASKKGWEAVCQGIPRGGDRNLQEQQLHINVLEMKVVKLALLACHKHFQMKAIHFQIDNTRTLSYLAKKGVRGGGRQKEVFNRITKRNLKVSLAPWYHNY